MKLYPTKQALYDALEDDEDFIVLTIYSEDTDELLGYVPEYV